MAFDLKKQAALAETEEKGFDVPVTHCTGEPVLNLDGTTQATIRVLGSLSKSWRKIQHELNGRGQHKDLAQLKVEAAETDEQAGARAFKENRELFAKAILGWSDGFTDSGETLPFSFENACKILDADPTIQGQVIAALNNHAAFFTKNSSA